MDPIPGETPIAANTPVFWARRFLHETLIHRADATLAVGAEFTADEDVAIDAIDEWMELGSLPQILDVHPQQRELLGPGRTLHFHATDTGPEASAEWLVDLTGDTIVWRRAHEKAAVAARGPLTDLLLTSGCSGSASADWRRLGARGAPALTCPVAECRTAAGRRVRELPRRCSGRGRSWRPRRRRSRP